MSCHCVTARSSFQICFPRPPPRLSFWTVDDNICHNFPTKCVVGLLAATVAAFAAAGTTAAANVLEANDDDAILIVGFGAVATAAEAVSNGPLRCCISRRAGEDVTRKALATTMIDEPPPPPPQPQPLPDDDDPHES